MRLHLLPFLVVAVALPCFAEQAGSSCSFSRGTTTCLTESTRAETTTATYYSGCFAGPTGVPGRRTRTFENTYLIVDQTTTQAHGRHGPVYSSQTSEISRTLESSVQVSDVCEQL